MNGKQKTSKSKMAIIATLALIVGLGCLCLPGSITPTSVPPPANTPTFPMAATTAPTLAVTGVLNTQGPWLLIETENGLWTANPDGSGLTRVVEMDFLNMSFFPARAVQPGGNLIVLKSVPDDYSHMSLNFISHPDGNITKITSLTTAETEAYVGSTDWQKYEAVQAVAEGGFSWSPDGSRLAFVGLLDGPSAEVYLYEITSGDITRVSFDNEQDYAIFWSPDGETLLYFTTEGFGTGAGFDTTGIWSANADGTNTTLIYSRRYGSLILYGWLDQSTLGLASWTALNGTERLRLFDITSGTETMLDEGPFLDATVDSSSGVMMFANESGLYLLTSEDRTPSLVSQEAVAQIDSMGPHDRVFTVRFENGEIATYGTGSSFDHQVSPVIAGPDAVDVAEYGLIWAWTSRDTKQPGVWITGPGVEIGQIFDQKARLPIWDLDNNLLFFAPDGSGGTTIYRTTFSGFYQELIPVNNIDDNVLDITWLGR